MTAMNFMSHGTQDMYPTLLGTFGYSKARIADITMFSMIGAVLGGLAFGAYSDRSGRRRAMITAATCGLVVLPMWIAGFSPLTTIVGVFLMQFFVQGAWGIIPAHINELSPAAARGFFPGLAYQLGVMFAVVDPLRGVHARRSVQLQAGDGRTDDRRLHRRHPRRVARPGGERCQLQETGPGDIPMKPLGAFVLVVSLAAVQPAPSPPPIIGRWDLTVRGARGDDAAWLEVRHSGINTLVGQFVATSGSARPISRVDFKDGELRFAIPTQWERADGDVVVAGRLDAETLKGTMTVAGGHARSNGPVSVRRRSGARRRRSGGPPCRC